MPRSSHQVDALDDEDALVPFTDEDEDYEEPSLEDLLPSILDPLEDEDEEEEEDE